MNICAGEIGFFNIISGNPPLSQLLCIVSNASTRIKREMYTVPLCLASNLHDIGDTHVYAHILSHTKTHLWLLIK